MSRITAENLSLAVCTYIESELIPQSSGLQKVGLYLAMPVIQTKAKALLEQFTPILGFLDSLNADGSVKPDVIFARIKDAVHKAGTVPVLGIIFDESDVDKLQAIASQFVQE
nr:MAG TPA: hypothetical protein [Caudoviricetes sp.]DAV99904.1 MAG TPA: hypothetical protein [Caudoviricetes sp.]